MKSIALFYGWAIVNIILTVAKTTYRIKVKRFTNVKEVKNDN